MTIQSDAESAAPGTASNRRIQSAMCACAKRRNAMRNAWQNAAKVTQNPARPRASGPSEHPTVQVTLQVTLQNREPPEALEPLNV